MTQRKIFDVRVHLLPPFVLRLIWRSYEREAWAIRYQLLADESIEFLQKAGVQKIAGICYTNIPGMAAFLNDFMAELHGRHPDTLVPFGTVFPGEANYMQEVDRALNQLEFAGIKVHCHLLQMAPDDDKLMPIFEAVEASGKVLNIHSGTVSKNNNNLDDIRRFCNVDRFRRALRRTPNLKVIVPHIGYDEVQEYLELMDEFPNLYFDTAMAIGGHRVAIGEPLPDARPLHYRHYERGTHPHLPTPWKPALEPLIPQILAKPTRFLYGSDFPNLPYLWNFEIDQLARYLPDDILQQILWANAANLFGCEQSAEDSEEIVLAGETS